MNYEERNQQSRGYRNFRTSLDLGMGILYIIIGALIIYARYFGTMELTTAFAYVLGGLMVVYGIFRIVRGLSGLRNSRRDISKDFPDLNHKQ
ncbi:MAG TPA: DUF308 domain-containing protein [Flavipsychrobacter sp.]|nr:DUF308 domain-containing protein [Flavipsychrobacter sp.]